MHTEREREKKRKWLLYSRRRTSCRKSANACPASTSSECRDLCNDWTSRIGTRILLRLAMASGWRGTPTRRSTEDGVLWARKPPPSRPFRRLPIDSRLQVSLSPRLFHSRYFPLFTISSISQLKKYQNGRQLCEQMRRMSERSYVREYTWRNHARGQIISHKVSRSYITVEDSVTLREIPFEYLFAIIQRSECGLLKALLRESLYPGGRV